MAAPSKLPQWANGGTVNEPSLAKKILGWVGGGEKPPFGVFNWWMNLVYQWIDWLNGTHVAYLPSVEDCIDELADDQVAILSPLNAAPDSPFNPLWSKTNGVFPGGTNGNVTHLCTNGKQVFVANDNQEIAAFSADDGSFLWSQALGGGGVAYMTCDGQQVWFVIAGASTTINRRVAATGAVPTWSTVVLAGNIAAITCDGGQVYGTTSTGTVEAFGPVGIADQPIQVWSNNAISSMPGTPVAEALDADGVNLLIGVSGVTGGTPFAVQNAVDGTLRFRGPYSTGVDGLQVRLHPSVITYLGSDGVLYMSQLSRENQTVIYNGLAGDGDVAGQAIAIHVPTNTIANIRYDIGSKFIAVVGEDGATESRALGFVWPPSAPDTFQTWDAVDSVFEAAFRAVTVDPLRLFLGGEPRQFGTAWTLTAHRMPSVPKIVRKVAVDGRRSPFKGELQEAI